MKCKEYKSHNMAIPKKLLQSVKRSDASYKEALQTKKKPQQKLEKDKGLLEIDGMLIQLNRKKSSLEEVIKGYHLVRDRSALDAEKKENIELLKMLNSFKRTASEKGAELETAMAKRKCLEDKRKNIS